MKKIKLALVALTTVLGVGGAIAGTTQSPGDYYTQQSGGSQIQGQKGTDWECDTQIVETCAYLELLSGQRQKVQGRHFEL